MKFLVTVEIPMPAGDGKFQPLKSSVIIEAPHRDAAAWQIECYGPSRIISIEPWEDSHVAA